MPEHTELPLPLRLEKDPFIKGFNCTVLDANGTPIFEVTATPLNAKPGPWTDQQKEWAELIVLAVNHHAELVASLRETCDAAAMMMRAMAGAGSAGEKVIKLLDVDKYQGFGKRATDLLDKLGA